MDPIAWRRRDALAVAAAALLAGPRAWAQSDTLRGQQIKLVVPFTPGSGTDVVVRIVSDALAPALGATVIVENRPGAVTSTFGRLASGVTPAKSLSVSYDRFE